MDSLIELFFLRPWQIKPVPNVASSRSNWGLINGSAIKVNCISRIWKIEIESEDEFSKTGVLPSRGELLWIIKFISGQPLLHNLQTGVPLFFIFECITLLMLHLFLLTGNWLRFRECKLEMHMKQRWVSFFNALLRPPSPRTTCPLILTTLWSLGSFSSAWRGCVC